MIYFESKDHKHIVILGPDDIDAIRSCNAILSEDKQVFVGYTPDVQWTSAEMAKAFNAPAGMTALLTPEKLFEILREGTTRPSKRMARRR